MAIQFLNHLDINENEIQNVALHNAAQGDFQNPVSGQIIFDNTANVNTLKYYNGSAWVSVTADTDDDVSVSNLITRLGEINSNVTIGNTTALTATFNGSVQINQNLTVKGTTTTVESTVTTFADPIIELNKVVGSGAQANPTTSGIEVVRASNDNRQLIWHEQDGKWKIETASNTYDNIAVTDDIPVSGTDFDPVGTDNSTNVTLVTSSYDYLSISGQQITLGQIDYSTDIANTPSIPVSGTDFDPVGTDNSTNVTLTGSYNYLTISGQAITLDQIDASTDISGLATVATSGAYSDLTGTPSIPVSGTDFDPVGTDNSTNVTLDTSSYNYLSLSGQEITLGQIDYSTDIANTPSIPVSGTDFDPVGTDNSTNVTLDTSSYNYLSLSGQEITLGQVDWTTDIANKPTIPAADTQLATKIADIDVSDSTFITNKRATINHQLGSSNVIVQMYDKVTGQIVMADVEFTSNGSTISSNHVRIEFAVVPTNDIRVIMIDAKSNATSVSPSYS